MNVTFVSIIYLISVLVVLGIGLFGLNYTWKRLEVRGAKSLFVVLFLLFAFTFIFFMGLFTRSNDGMFNLMLVAHALIMILPFPWAALVFDIANHDWRKLWYLIIVWAAVKITGFMLLIFQPEMLLPPLQYKHCAEGTLINTCYVEQTLAYYIIMGLILVEVLGVNIYLLIHLLQPKQIAERAKYMLLLISMTIGSVLFFVIAIFIDLPQDYNSIPLGAGIMVILLVNALFNKELLNLGTSSEEAVQPVNDILLMIDADHFVQDMNMSALQVFNMDLSDLLNAQLEHAFLDFPEIINLFNEVERSETVDLPIGGELHTFQPVLSDEVDPLTKVVSGKRLLLKDVTQQPQAASGKVSSVITTDPLTGQYDKQAFYQLGERIFNNSRRLQQPLAFAVMNIDDFQQVNQRFSHLVGDQILLELVEIINAQIRQSDLFARLDGDSLVVLLPKVDEFSAYQICARMKESISSHKFLFNNQEFQVTVSMGYTTHTLSPDSQWTLDGLFEVAMKALEQSKALGRNRLTFLPAQAVVEERFVPQSR